MPGMTNYDRLINYFLITVIFLNLSFSNGKVTDLQDQIHIIVVDKAFDFFTWTVDAAWIKIQLSSINAPHYFSPTQQHNLVIESLDIIHEIDATNSEINRIYSDPSVKDPITASQKQKEKLSNLNQRWNIIGQFAESTLEMQVTSVLTDLALTVGGQPVPAVLYHVTPLPQNLVISKREKIGAETNYILTPLSIQDEDRLEKNVDERLNVSSIVVEIGGLAAYPTMIMRTASLDWLVNTIAHEWTHLYLGQHPLGNNYNSPELRTMNETTASISGSEIGKIVMNRYFPEMVTQNNLQENRISMKIPATKPPIFDFRNEMHITRTQADELLAQGKIIEAEQYMNSRRQLFWDNGYTIRKINQAYFAFYGSYADTPGGAAGEDPVGPAVRALRAQSGTLKEFLERISNMTTFAQLQQAIINK